MLSMSVTTRVMCRVRATCQVPMIDEGKSADRVALAKLGRQMSKGTFQCRSG